MKNFVKTIGCCAALFVGGNLYAQNLDCVPAGLRDSLLKDKELSHLLSAQDTKPVYIPTSDYAGDIRNFVWGNVSAEKMGFAAEKLFLINKAELENKNQSELNAQTAGVILRSISKMNGMKYFSHSRNVWNTLYDKAYRVESAAELKKPAALADLTSGSANGKELYAFLNDHTFGEYIYKISYKQNNNEVLMLIENASVISYGPVKAVKPGDLKISVLVKDCGDAFVLYMGGYAEFKITSALKKRINNSFEARLEAIYNWFKTQF